MRLRLLVLALLLAVCGRAVAAERVYRSTDQTCDGWPRATIGMAPGFCAGIVVAPPEDFRKRLLVFPRLLLPLAGGRDWLVTDLGHWGAHDGKVIFLTAVPGQPAQMRPLLSGLFNPHGLARGPDGKIYIGEIGRIFRFDPDAPDPQATIEAVITDLPAPPGNRHPLSFFLFDTNGDLLVEIGAPTDQCAIDGKPDGTSFCTESEGDVKMALVRRHAYLGGGKWNPQFTVVARGLRNSLALTRHKSGTLLQAENSIDFPGDDSPFEELNVLHDGKHYGWPYCHDMDRPAPAWASLSVMDCASPAHEKPVRLLPPHAAPLSMLYYDGAMFPKLRGDLLMSWHGYRAAGARIAAFTVDAHGIPLRVRGARYTMYGDEASIMTRPYPGPASSPLLLTPHWEDAPGEHPRGSPTGLAVAEDGAIWVAEDRNATILRIARDTP